MIELLAPYAQVARALSCANFCATHQALITSNMSCCMPRGTQGQLNYLSLTDLKSHLFEFYFIG